MAQPVRGTQAAPVPAPPVAGPVTLGDPAPLGLSAFALTTFVLSVMNAGIIDATKYLTIVLGLAVFYGGLAQLLAGMWELRNGNTFGATAFTSFGAFWLAYAAIFVPGLGVTVTHISNPHPAFGLFLLAWAIFTAMMTIGAARLNGALLAVFVLLTLTYASLTVGEIAGNMFFGHLGGWLGIGTAIAAWYTALAGILRGVTGGALQLPIYPLK